MAVLSNYLINALINGVYRNTAFTPPTTVYLGLFLTNPTPSNTGTEVTGGSYARQAVTFAAPSGQQSLNSGTITFPTASANWGTIAYLAIFDAVSGGNLLSFAPANIAVVVNSGNTYTINASQLTVSFV